MRKALITNTGLLLLLVSLLPLPAVAGAWQTLAGSAPCATYQPMTMIELQQAEATFQSMLLGRLVSDESIAARWEALGYQVFQPQGVGPEWIGIREGRSPCRGQGAYLFARNPSGSIVLQAPHAYSDRHTGEISAGMLGRGVSVLSWNTARRRIRGDSGQKDADLARRADSMFLALTRAMAKSLPAGRLVQIHGFDNGRRTSQAGASAAVILSSGSRWVTPALAAVAGCLRTVIDGPVLLYPADVVELGATRNLHGKTLRRHGHEGFIHIELNRPTRELLRSDARLRARFSSCMDTGGER